MRTPTAELLRKTVARLSESVAPELSTPYARAQIRYAFSLLDTISAETDGAADTLLHENERVQAFLRGAHVAAAAPDAPESLHALAPALAEGASLPAAADIRISSLAARNDALWAAATPLIDLLGEHDGEPWSDPLRAEARPLLHAYVEARRYRPGT